MKTTPSLSSPRHLCNRFSRVLTGSPDRNLRSPRMAFSSVDLPLPHVLEYVLRYQKETVMSKRQVACLAVSLSSLSSHASAGDAHTTRTGWLMERLLQMLSWFDFALEWELRPDILVQPARCRLEQPNIPGRSWFSVEKNRTTEQQ